MNRLRIGIVTSSFPPKSGGIATSHYNLFCLLGREYEVRAFVYDDGDRSRHPNVVRRHTPALLGNALSRVMRCYLRRYDKAGNFLNCSRLARVAFGVWRLGPPLRQFRPDVVLVPDFDLPAYFLRKPKNAKYVWFCRHNYRRFGGHPLLDNNWWSDIDVAASMERRALRKADVVVSPSSYMAREFRRTYGREDLAIRVIPNFIVEEAFASIEPYPLRAELRIPAEVPIVCIPSAGTVPKGKRHTFEIVRQVGRQFGSKIVFFLTGGIPGDLAYELQHVREPILVYAPGHVPWRENVSRVMACDLVVSPALVENFSNALVEAHSLGKAVVTFDTGGNREIVQDGETGYVVPYLDIDCLVDRTVSLLHDPTQRIRFGERAQSLTRLTLSPNRALEQYRQLFAELVA